jgi:class 3 adenylate cyclase
MASMTSLSTMRSNAGTSSSETMQVARQRSAKSKASAECSEAAIPETEAVTQDQGAVVSPAHHRDSTGSMDLGRGAEDLGTDSESCQGVDRLSTIVTPQRFTNNEVIGNNTASALKAKHLQRNKSIVLGSYGSATPDDHLLFSRAIGLLAQGERRRHSVSSMPEDASPPYMNGRGSLPSSDSGRHTPTGWRKAKRSDESPQLRPGRLSFSSLSSDGSAGKDLRRNNLDNWDSTGSCDDGGSYSVTGFFRPFTSSTAIKKQHLDLGRIAGDIFVLNQDVTAGLDAASVEQRTRWNCSRRCGCCKRCPGRSCYGAWWNHMQMICRKLGSNGLFTAFFLVLTLYVLFSPDILDLVRRKYLDYPFLVINTVVFGLFSFELLVLIVGNRSYGTSAFVVLDIVCLASLLTDTLLVDGYDVGVLMSEDNARLSRVARSSRTVRLVRLVRLARVARMLPKLLMFLRTQNLQLGQQVLLRRLWRGFFVLDADKDDLISEFDLKVFYLIVLRECPDMLRHTPAELLSLDKEYIEKSVFSDPDSQEDDVEGRLDFQKFSQIMLNTRLGKDLVNHHVEDLEMGEGVWSLTQKLSDNTAMKVCACVLCLLITVSLLEIDAVDAGALVGLAQLDHMVRSEALFGALNFDYLCNQISPFWDRTSVLFLHLDGMSFENGCCKSCYTNATIDSAIDLMNEKIRTSRLRPTDMDSICLVGGTADVCSATGLGGVRSLALLDMSDQVQTDAQWSIITTITMLLLLLAFVFILNRKITSFTRTILQPLRWLVDDMQALSSLELLTMDKDMPGGGVVKTVEELNHLQSAFQSMQSAIRGWSMFVPPMVVQRLFSSGIEAGIGVNKCHVTILFCDVVKFDEMCIGLEPNEIIDLLSAVGNFVAEAIEKKAGTLLEFIGDETVSVFNVPNHVKNHYVAGLEAAREIHRVIDDHNPFVSHEGKELEIKCRCGVHTARMLAGNIGSPQRIKYGLLGDGINLAARLKGLNSRYGTRTLVSDSTLQALKTASGFPMHSMHYRPVDVVAVKGKVQGTPVYEALPLYANEDHQKLMACEKHQKAFELYQQRRFDQAAELFQEVENTFVATGCDKDVASRILRKRCLEYMKDPPPEDWDGVDRLQKKTFAVDDDEVPPAAEGDGAASGDGGGTEAVASPVGIVEVASPRSDVNRSMWCWSY